MRLLLAVELAAVLVVSLFSLDAISRYPRDLGRHNHFWTDASAMVDCASRLTLQGHNPYHDMYLVDCFTRLRMDGRFGTPLLAGRFAHAPDQIPRDLVIQTFATARRQHVQHPAEFESYVSYPAGSFLLPAPFIALGWPDLGAFYLACAVAVYAGLAVFTPPHLRAWLVLLALGNLNLWAYIVRGFDEGPVILLALAAWILRRHTYRSAALLGAAVATRQDAWTLALFYMVWVGRSHGWRAVLTRSATVGLVFALINGPFAAQSSADWFNGVLGPLKDSMLPAGIGLVGLRQPSGLPLWPHPTFTALMLLVLAASLVYYGIVCRRHPHVGLVLAVVPLLFAWRSLFVYFFSPLPILCLWPLLSDDAPAGEAVSGQQGSTVPVPVPNRRSRPASTWATLARARLPS